MSVQRIDFERLVVLLLPSRMRGVRLMSLVRALVAPLVSLSERRMREREERMFWLRTTGQRRLLRYALNRWFGVSGFEIEDATARGSWLTVYDESGNDRPTMIDGGTTLYDEASVVGEYAFTVRVPKELSDSVPTIRHIVDRYKPAGKSYEIMENGKWKMENGK